MTKVNAINDMESSLAGVLLQSYGYGRIKFSGTIPQENRSAENEKGEFES